MSFTACACYSAFKHILLTRMQGKKEGDFSFDMGQTTYPHWTK